MEGVEFGCFDGCGATVLLEFPLAECLPAFECFFDSVRVQVIRADEWLVERLACVEWVYACCDHEMPGALCVL